MPLKNFHAHQIEHMRQVVRAKIGICFVLLHFSTLKETYLLPAIHLIHYYHSDQGTKSMPLTYIREFGYVVEMNSFPSLPYLSVIEKTIRW